MSHDRYAAGRRDRYAAGRRDRYAAGRRDRYAAGRRDRYAAGRQDRYAAGQQDRYAASDYLSRIVIRGKLCTSDYNNRVYVSTHTSTSRLTTTLPRDD